jgi:hypothetical protein
MDEVSTVAEADAGLFTAVRAISRDSSSKVADLHRFNEVPP